VNIPGNSDSFAEICLTRQLSLGNPSPELKLMTVGIIVPTYNSAPFLLRALHSISRQERLPDEVLLVDDGSSDDTLAISAAWASQQPFSVRLLNNYTAHDPAAGRGPAAGRQTGLHAATADLLALLDHDDEMLPAHLRLTAGALEGHAELTLCFGDAVERFSSGREQRLLGESTISSLSFAEMTDGLRLIEESFVPAIVHGSRIATAANLWRRDAALEIGGFDVRAGTCDDWLFFLSLATVGRVAYFQSLIANKYAHEGNLSHPRNRLRMTQNAFAALLVFLESPLVQKISGADMSLLLAQRDYVARCLFFEASQGGVPLLFRSVRNIPLSHRPAFRDWLRASLVSLGIVRSPLSGQQS